jgi:SAM-dependent methyltransferase
VTLPNVYSDQRRAEAYAKLEFPGTYYLAYRDLPEIIGKHVNGKRAVDFGCGAGRSTRFLKRLGFDAIGVDISAEMVAKAKEFDPTGDYRLLGTEGLKGLGQDAYDVILSCFTFDNVPKREEKLALFTQLGRLLAPSGCIVNLVSSPEIYWNEWASFSTKDYPENRWAKCGDVVRVVMLDVEDRRPVEDVIFPEADYRKVYAEAGLEVVEVYRPLGRADEPFAWVNETTIPPWTIYVLKRV